MTPEPSHEACAEPTTPLAPPPEPTGVAEVDAVVEAVTSAADLPLTERVGVFERAQGDLRRALDSGTPR